jgi:hypothetical protein
MTEVDKLPVKQAKPISATRISTYQITSVPRLSAWVIGSSTIIPIMLYMYMTRRSISTQSNYS